MPLPSYLASYPAPYPTLDLLFPPPPFTPTYPPLPPLPPLPPRPYPPALTPPLTSPPLPPPPYDPTYPPPLQMVEDEVPMALVLEADQFFVPRFENDTAFGAVSDTIASASLIEGGWYSTHAPPLPPTPSPPQPLTLHSPPPSPLPLPLPPGTCFSSAAAGTFVRPISRFAVCVYPTGRRAKGTSPIQVL